MTSSLPTEPTGEPKAPPPWQDRLSQLLHHLVEFLRSDTFAYIVKRLLQGLLTLLLASVMCFLVADMAPGDFLSTYKENPKVSAEFIEQMRVQYGLDKSLPEQYWRWLWQILSQGNFGPSMAYKQPAVKLLAERVPATLLMAIASLVFTWAIAIPLGIIGAVKQNQWVDRVFQVLSYIGQGFPSFITALFLLLFAQITSPLFPVGDMTSIDHADLTGFGKALDISWHMILPVIALSITSFAGLQRITRGEMLDVLRQDYIQTARAKGLPENKVIYVHALRNAVNPLITLLGFEFASLLSGAFITEYFFNWPGLGRLILQSVQSLDTYLVMASLMMGSAMLIIGNLLADLLLKAVDPRIKLGDS
jgi:peptide/nickel transport system permease protein